MGKKIFLFIFIAVFYSISSVFANYQPEIGDNMMIQLQGDINTSYNVDVYSIDLFDTSADFIQELQSEGKGVICYLSVGTYEDWREDAVLFPDSVLGDDLGDWPGEKWLDISKYEEFQHIMLERLNLAQEKGCDGIDPDNVDAFQNDTGLELTAEDQKKYLLFLAQEAKSRNLLIGLKNNLSQVKELEPYFDFAVNESCFDWNECEYLTDFIENNKPVFGLQYNKSLEDFCPQAQEMNMSFALANYDLDGTKMEFCNELSEDINTDITDNESTKEETNKKERPNKGNNSDKGNKSKEEKMQNNTFEQGEILEEENIDTQAVITLHPLQEQNPELAQKVDSIFEKINSKYSDEKKNTLYKKLKQKLLLLKMSGQYSKNSTSKMLVSYILESIPQ